jgi:hypothetical protein
MLRGLFLPLPSSFFLSHLLSVALLQQQGTTSLRFGIIDFSFFENTGERFQRQN